jgi:hypothetical protein
MIPVVSLLKKGHASVMTHGILTKPVGRNKRGALRRMLVPKS